MRIVVLMLMFSSLAFGQENLSELWQTEQEVVAKGQERLGVDMAKAKEERIILADQSLNEIMNQIYKRQDMDRQMVQSKEDILRFHQEIEQKKATARFLQDANRDNRPAERLIEQSQQARNYQSGGCPYKSGTALAALCANRSLMDDLWSEWKRYRVPYYHNQEAEYHFPNQLNFGPHWIDFSMRDKESINTWFMGYFSAQADGGKMTWTRDGWR